VTPRSPTLRQTVEGMALGFDPEAASGGAAVIEFEAPQERPARCHLVVQAGACRFATGSAPAPTLRIRTDGDTWRRIGAGELELLSAASSGVLSVTGELGQLAQLRRWFRNGAALPLRAQGRYPPGPVRLPPMAWLAVAFLPWKVLAIGAALGWPRTAAATAAVLALGLLSHRSRFGTATYFERAGATALAGLAAAAALGLDLGGTRAGVATTGALGALWGLGAALRPLALTGEYSRWSYAPALAETALFRHPNALITVAWSTGFLVSAGAQLARGRGLLGGGAALLLQLTTLGICLGLTRAQEGGARQRRIDDIDGRLRRLRSLGLALAAAGAAVLAGGLS